MKTINHKSFSWKLLGSFLIALFLLSCGDDEDSTPKATNVDIVTMSPGSPSTLKYYQAGLNDRVTIDFNYVVTQEDGVRIFIKPLSSTATQGTLYSSPSPIFKGNGTDQVFVSAISDSSSVIVDQITIRIYNAANTVLVSEEFLDVNYTFSK